MGETTPFVRGFWRGASLGSSLACAGLLFLPSNPMWLRVTLAVLAIWNLLVYCAHTWPEKDAIS